MNEKELLIPRQYNLYMQRLNPFEIEYLGFVRNQAEAINMLQIFQECYMRSVKGNVQATFFFTVQ